MVALHATKGWRKLHVCELSYLKIDRYAGALRGVLRDLLESGNRTPLVAAPSC